MCGQHPRNDAHKWQGAFKKRLRKYSQRRWASLPAYVAMSIERSKTRSPPPHMVQFQK